MVAHTGAPRPASPFSTVLGSAWGRPAVEGGPARFVGTVVGGGEARGGGTLGSSPCAGDGSGPVQSVRRVTSSVPPSSLGPPYGATRTE